MDTVAIFKPVTRYSAEVVTTSSISDVMSIAFRAAEGRRSGASFVSLPMAIVNAPTVGALTAYAPPHSEPHLLRQSSKLRHC